MQNFTQSDLKRQSQRLFRWVSPSSRRRTSTTRWVASSDMGSVIDHRTKSNGTRKSSNIPYWDWDIIIKCTL